MMEFKEIETKWMKFWEDHPEVFRADDKSTKEKKYILVEFPYPSGSGLHVGHAFTFLGGDVLARFRRMQGYNVMFPMGWDAFGLPTENYAIKMKRKPQEVTKENTDMFRSQMKRLGFSFDWSREVNTTDPSYYKWTQWIFIKLFEKGLAYKKEMPINWCPSCKIGLANEEVVDGKCERCGSEVSRRNISQWVVRITEYADKLAEGLKNTDFIDKVKAAQVNWIGKSTGARVRFKVKDSSQEIEVFTTRPDTLYGATFMVIAPEHELAGKAAEGSEEIKKYLVESRKKSELERAELNKEKTGVFSGIMAINPITGKEIPVWISDFVLASYGTGAIMAVPAHDERDHAFAVKFGLPIVPVIMPEIDWDFEKQAYTEVDKGKMINSPKWDGLAPSEAIGRAIGLLKEMGIGEATNSYHLRDWIFSRQHYWGEPIPMIKCEVDGWQPVPEADLPIRLPEVDAYEPTDDGKSPLSKISEWVKCECPVCGKEAERETDTMPNWAGSDWYFLRYIDPVNDMVLASQELMKKWLPVDVYVGGDEHNTLHLLYSRFIYLFLRDIGAVPTEIKEPYYKRLSHGVILGPDGNRMSKSKGNVIVPETVAEKYGVDVTRLYLMFMGPYDGTMAWNEKTLMGVKRFLDRIHSYLDKHYDTSSASNQSNDLIINRAVDGVTKDLGEFGYNTAVAKLMEAINQLNETGMKLSSTQAKTLLKLIAPLAPYTAEEWWSRVGGQEEAISVHASRWPTVNEEMLLEATVTIPVAINGKVREQISINRTDLGDTAKVVETAKASEKISKWIGSSKVVKEIYIPGKMVNLVIV